MSVDKPTCFYVLGMNSIIILKQRLHLNIIKLIYITSLSNLNNYGFERGKSNVLKNI